MIVGLVGVGIIVLGITIIVAEKHIPKEQRLIKTTFLIMGVGLALLTYAIIRYEILGLY